MERLQADRDLLLQYIFDNREALLASVPTNAIPLSKEVLAKINVPALVAAVRAPGGPEKRHLTSAKSLVRRFCSDSVVAEAAASQLEDDDDDHFMTTITRSAPAGSSSAMVESSVSLDNFLASSSALGESGLEESEKEPQDGDDLDGEEKPFQWSGKYLTRASASLFMFEALFLTDREEEFNEEDRNIVSDVIRAQLELSRRVYRRLSKWSTPDDLETKLFGNVNGIIELLKSVESASAFGGDEKFFAEWRTSKAELLLQVFHDIITDKFGGALELDLGQNGGDELDEIASARQLLERVDAVAYENGIRRTEYSDETLSILIDDLFHCFCGVVAQDAEIPLPRRTISLLLRRVCDSFILDNQDCIDLFDHTVQLVFSRLSGLFCPQLEQVELHACIAAALARAVVVGGHENDDFVERMQGAFGDAQVAAADLVDGLNNNSGQSLLDYEESVSLAFDDLCSLLVKDLSDYHQTFSLDIDGIGLLMNVYIEAKRVVAILQQKDGDSDFAAVKSSIFQMTVGRSVDHHLRRTLGNEFGGGEDDPFPRSEEELVKAINKIKSELEGEFDYFLKDVDDEMARQTRQAAASACESFIKSAISEVIPEGYELKDEIAEVYAAARDLEAYLQVMRMRRRAFDVVNAALGIVLLNEYGACKEGFKLNDILTASLDQWTQLRLQRCDELVQRCVARDEAAGWPINDPDNDMYFAPAVVDITDMYFQFVDTFESFGINSSMDTVKTVARALDTSLTFFAQTLRKTIPSYSLPNLPAPIHKQKIPGLLKRGLTRKNLSEEETNIWGGAEVEELHKNQKLEDLLVRYNSAFQMLDNMVKLSERDSMVVLADYLRDERESQSTSQRQLSDAELLFPTSSSLLREVAGQAARYIAFKCIIFDLYPEMIGRLFRPAPRKNVNELGAIADTKLNPILGKVVEYVSDKFFNLTPEDFIIHTVHCHRVTSLTFIPFKQTKADIILFQIVRAFYEMIERALLEGPCEDMSLAGEDCVDALDRELDSIQAFFSAGLDYAEVAKIDRFTLLYPLIASQSMQLVERYAGAVDFQPENYESKYYIFRVLARRKGDVVAKKFIDKFMNSKNDRHFIKELRKTKSFYFH